MAGWTLPIAQRRLFAEAVRLEDARAGRVHDLAESIDDWVDLARAAKRLAVLGAVGTTLLRTGAMERAPAPVAEAWTLNVAEQAARNALLMDDVAAVASALERAGVRALFMKGSALLATAYASLGARHLDDVDVLVPAETLPDVRACLAELDFTMEERFEGMAIDGRPLHEHMDPDHHSDVGSISPRGTAFDVHLKIPEVDARSFDSLWSHAEWVACGAHRIRVPTPDHHMRMVCEHVVAHHDALPRYWPRHLADMMALERTFGSAVWADASNGAVALCRAALAWCERSPDDASKLLFPSDTLQDFSGYSLHTLMVAQRNARDLFRNPQKLGRKLMPARSFIADLYGVPESGWLAPYYVHRLATLRFLRHRESA